MRRPTRSAALLSSLCIISGIVLSFLAPSSSATEVTIFEEDFDGDWPPEFYVVNPTPGSWKVADNNAASGLDYWGRTSYKSHHGIYSAWCAQNGVNSVNMQPNSDNHYYDQDMQSCMMVYLGNIDGYSSAFVSFAYWAKTGTTSPDDHLELRAFTGSAWVELWTQPNVGTMTWESASSELPASTTWVGWFFFSDSEVGLGPYEGVYVDTIHIGGNDVDRPVSSVESLDPYWVGDMIYVPYLANDSFGSGVEYVELFYRHNSTDVFQRYAPEDNPSGEWTSGLIPFNGTAVLGDGIYEFYTLATDNALNKELAPGSGDAYAVLDNSVPTTTASMIESPTLNGWYTSDIHVFLSAFDIGSGVGGTLYRIGMDDWHAYEDGVVISSDGTHHMQFYSEDRACNKEQVRTLELRIDRQAPSLELTSPEEGAEVGTGDVLVSWECSDGSSGINRFAISIDGKFDEYCNASTREFTVSGLDPGEHQLVLTAVDNAGNSAEVVFDFNVAGEGTGVLDNPWAMATIIGVMLLMVFVIVVLLEVRRRSRGGRGREMPSREGDREKGQEGMSPAVPSAPSNEQKPKG